ncbi:MAG: aminoacyl-tRNA hydrolase [Lachnospiraceae bacterium]|nr:aminoacyl-tRNA hydrolase [Lachnospiraceae bacterium]
MILIAGLGNPENRYSATRHNTGFLAVDRIAERCRASFSKKEKNALTVRVMIGGKSVLLCKPQTYMNLSGESIMPLVSWYRVDASKDLLVIADDIHLEPGRLRLRKGGSDGGHNGLKNIIEMLGTNSFPRLRVGVGEAGAVGGLIPHVLGNWSREEWTIMDKALDNAASAAEMFVTDGIDAAMNRFNSRIVIPEEEA